MPDKLRQVFTLKLDAPVLSQGELIASFRFSNLQWWRIERIEGAEASRRYTEMTNLNQRKVQEHLEVRGMVSSAWSVCELSGNHAKADEKPEYEFSLGKQDQRAIGEVLKAFPSESRAIRKVACVTVPLRMWQRWVERLGAPDEIRKSHVVLNRHRHVESRSPPVR
jgi:hypothetical protein